ncbi:MAG: hypothetical protein DWQ40_11460 [Actinobacteria bacterium]|nr:MAG: hypothetical protein DWQ40_11460 [Actinomycetota bacterium]REK40570.1 MAG: hypothetical protein DWQ20_01625 [Actinomycetota bacterium]
MTAESKLVGTWRLVEWTATIDGNEVTPFGGPTTGLLTYTEEGRMWGTLMRVDRPVVDGDTLAAAPEEERAAAAAGYLNYAGTWHIEGDEVIHEVEVSLLPNWIGTSQRRKMQWVENDMGGSDLILSASSTTRHGAVASNRLRWRHLVDWKSDQA